LALVNGQHSLWVVLALPHQVLDAVDRHVQGGNHGETDLGQSQLVEEFEDEGGQFSFDDLPDLALLAGVLAGDGVDDGVVVEEDDGLLGVDDGRK